MCVYFSFIFVLLCFTGLFSTVVTLRLLIHSRDMISSCYISTVIY